MKELIPNHSQLNREEQLGLANKYLEKVYDLIAQYQYTEAIIDTNKALELFEKIEHWEKLIETRCQKIYLWRMLRSEGVLNDAELFVAKTLELYHQKFSQAHAIGSRLFQEISLYS